VLPVGGVTAKIEAAAEMGMKTVLIPEQNLRDVVLEDRYIGKIRVIPVRTLNDVLSHALVGSKKEGLLKKLAALVAAGRKPTSGPSPKPSAPASAAERAVVN
jgi:Lon-like ATP-dependent protease